MIVTISGETKGSDFDLQIDRTEDKIDPRGHDAPINETFTIQIQNTDILGDNFMFQALEEPLTFSVMFDGEESLIIHLNPGEEEIVEMVVQASLSTTFGDYPFTLKVNSSDEIENISFTITVLAPRIEITPQDIHLSTGTVGSEGIEIRIWNNGTSEIRWLNLTVFFDGIEVGKLYNLTIGGQWFRDIMIEYDLPNDGSHNVTITTRGAFPSEIQISTDITIEKPPHASNGSDDKEENTRAYVMIGVVLLVLGGILYYRRKK